MCWRGEWSWGVRELGDNVAGCVGRESCAVVVMRMREKLTHV